MDDVINQWLLNREDDYLDSVEDVALTDEEYFEYVYDQRVTDARF